MVMTIVPGHGPLWTTLMHILTNPISRIVYERGNPLCKTRGFVEEMTRVLRKSCVIRATLVLNMGET
jgi:hypothetical protein